uniref:Uncharacterized protein n=1 Tax=Anopheles minimus TaxID=112268 RepID=A0A182W7K4_9DIPT
MTENSRIVKDSVAPVIVKGATANGHHPQMVNGGHAALGKDGKKVAVPLLEADAHVVHEPPDGGTRAWLVMVGAFLCNGVLFGVINTYSVVYLSLQKQLLEIGDTEASGKAASLFPLINTSRQGGGDIAMVRKIICKYNSHQIKAHT